MPIKRVVVGTHRLSGENVIRVYNPVGTFEKFFVQNGEGPYSGLSVLKGDIIPKGAEPEVIETDKMSEAQMEKVIEVLEQASIYENEGGE